MATNHNTVPETIYFHNETIKKNDWLIELSWWLSTRNNNIEGQN